MAKTTIRKVEPIGKPFKSQGILKIQVTRKDKKIEPVITVDSFKEK